MPRQVQQLQLRLSKFLSTNLPSALQESLSLKSHMTLANALLHVKGLRTSPSYNIQELYFLCKCSALVGKTFKRYDYKELWKILCAFLPALLQCLLQQHQNPSELTHLSFILHYQNHLQSSDIWQCPTTYLSDLSFFLLALGVLGASGCRKRPCRKHACCLSFLAQKYKIYFNSHSISNNQSSNGHHQESGK